MYMYNVYTSIHGCVCVWRSVKLPANMLTSFKVFKIGKADTIEN